MQKSRSIKRSTENINVILKAEKESKEKTATTAAKKSVSENYLTNANSLCLSRRQSNFFIVCGFPSSDHYIALFTVRFFVLRKPLLVSRH